jgi:hypothetical protein
MMPLFDYYNEQEDDGSWNWFYCSMLSENTLDTIEKPWPVFADSFDSAMQIFMVLVKLKYYGVS